ncbi:hypothetical protein [Chromobacterium vaccinii]|uniref:hypothetical protein n=1 Tax=Chromobacterium vaccinii TaxID=1108595 RepID=UPI000E13D64B|nr:hypothetical protein [Chromobacterium vaccinii]SUX30079.1 Uncharacterised protein [Chromobacterium vaccinii]
MLRLTVSHTLPAGEPQALDRQALQQALQWQPGLPAEAHVDRLRRPLRRLDEQPLSLADRLHALRALFEACLPLMWRGAGTESDRALRGLWRELHEACKLLAQACAARRAGRFSDGGLLRQALGLALGSAWQLQRGHALGYAPLFPGFWQDSHQLFAEARRRGWEGRVAIDGQPSLGAGYRQMLLLGITSSNRLDPARQSLLLDWIVGHGQALRLEGPPKSGVEVEGWLVSAEADSPGRFAAIAAAETAGGYWRVDAADVARRLRAAAHARADEFSAAQWQLLGRLEQEWSRPPQRRHLRRNQRNGQRVIVVGGFDACWRLAEEGRLPDDVETGELLLGNLSPSGMRLYGDCPPGLLQAGALVMLKRRGFEWQLGLVRWISLPGGDALAECGVEFVGKRPQAVGACAVTSHPGAPLEPGLLLQAERHFRHRGVLVLQGRQYQALRPFQLRADGGEWLVRAQRLLQQTGSCQLMEIRLEDAVDMPQAGEPA